MTGINFAEMAKSLKGSLATEQKNLEYQQYVPVMNLQNEFNIKLRPLMAFEAKPKLTRLMWYYNTSRGRWTSECARVEELKALYEHAKAKGLDPKKELWKYDTLEKVMMAAHITHIENPNDYDKKMIGKTVLLLMRRQHALPITEQIGAMNVEDIMKYMNGAEANPVMYLRSWKNEDGSWGQSADFLVHEPAVIVPEDQRLENMSYFKNLDDSYVKDSDNPTDEDLRALRQEIDRKAVNSTSDSYASAGDKDATTGAPAPLPGAETARTDLNASEAPVSSTPAAQPTNLDDLLGALTSKPTTAS